MGDDPVIGRIPLKGGDEFDALTSWRRFFHWKAGDRKAIKRGYNRRVRRLGKRLTDV